RCGGGTDQVGVRGRDAPSRLIALALFRMSLDDEYKATAARNVGESITETTGLHIVEHDSVLVEVERRAATFRAHGAVRVVTPAPRAAPLGCDGSMEALVESIEPVEHLGAIRHVARLVETGRGPILWRPRERAHILLVRVRQGLPLYDIDAL